MSSLQFTGIVHEVKETQQISDTFCKREFILTDNDENYPKFILFELVKDNVDLINDIGVGAMITVSFNLEGRLWMNPKTNVERCFNSLKAWKIEATEGAVQPQQAPPQQEQGNADDLPF